MLLGVDQTTGLIVEFDSELLNLNCYLVLNKKWSDYKIKTVYFVIGYSF